MPTTPNPNNGAPTSGLTANSASSTSLTTILASSGIYSSVGFALGKIKHRSVKSGKGTKVSETNSIANRRIIYGTMRTAGVHTYVTTSADSVSSNGNLHFVITLAGHEVNSIGAMYFNNVEVPLTYDSGDGAWYCLSGTYKDLIQLEKHLGTPSDTSQPFPRLHANVSQWSDTCLQRGCAKVHLRLTWSQDAFPNGVPQGITFDIEGKKVYDPRLSPPATVFSNNAALCVRDWLVDTQYGLGVDTSTIDDTSVIAAANVCDEAIDLREGGTHARYTCDGTFDTAVAQGSVLASLVTSMAGTLVPPGDSWKMFAGEYRDSVVDLTDTDLRGTMKMDTRLSRRDQANAIKGTYISPSNDWQQSDFPPYKNADFISADGGQEVYADLTLDFVTDGVRAQRIAKVNLEKKRRRVPLTIPCKLTAFKAEPGDTISFTHPRWGFDAKTFIVNNTSLVLDDKGGDVALGYDLVCMPNDTEIYFWDPDVDEGTVLAVDEPDLPDSKNVGAPTSLVLTSDSTTTIIRADGVAHSQILVAWTPPTDTHVLNGGFIEIFIKKVSDSDTAYLFDGVAFGDADHYFIAKNIKDGVDYDVKIRSVNTHGAHSSSLIGSIICSGAASTFVSTGAPGPVGVYNNDFEVSDTLPPVGWTVKGTPTLDFDTTTQQQGARSLKVTSNVQYEGVYTSAKYQVVPGDVFTGERWKVGGYIKGDGTGHGIIVFRFFDATDTEIGTPVIADGGNPTPADWNFYSATGLAPNDAVYARVFLQNDTTSGTSNLMEFDSIILFRVASLEDEVTDGPSRGAITAANTSYRPLTNPLTAKDDGGSTEIDIASFTMRVANGNDVSINSGVISGLAYNTTYHVYYDDPTYAGGTVSFYANTNQAIALDATGRFYVGSIQTPTIGGVDTVGNNDGGTGAQSGQLYWLSPTLRADHDLESGRPLWSPAYANDTDGDTGLNPVVVTKTDNIFLGGIPTIYSKWKSLKLKIRSEVVHVNDGYAAFARYSLDDGDTWNDIFDIETGSQEEGHATSAAQSGSGTAWTNPSDLIDPNNYATITGMAHGLSSKQDQATGFGFSVPSGSTIDGITVKFDEQASGGTGDEVPTFNVQLLKAGTPVGVVKPVAGQPIATLSLGDDSDLWSDAGHPVTWSVTDINDPNFGFQVQVTTPNAAAGWQANTYYSPLAIIFVTVSSVEYVFQIDTKDANGNPVGGTTGGSAPTWDTTPGNPTTDNTVTWVCLQAGGTTWAAGQAVGGSGWKFGDPNSIVPGTNGQFIKATAAGVSCVFELTKGTDNAPPRHGDLTCQVWSTGDKGGQFTQLYPALSSSTFSPVSLHWANSSTPPVNFPYSGSSVSTMKVWTVNGDGTLGTPVDTGRGGDTDFAVYGSMFFSKAGIYSFLLETDDGGGIGFDNQVDRVSGTVVYEGGDGRYSINPGTKTAVNGYPIISGRNAEGHFWNYFSVNAKTDGVVSKFEINLHANGSPNYLDLKYLDPATNTYKDIIPYTTGLTTEATHPAWPAWSTVYNPKWPSVSESNGNIVWVNRGPAAAYTWQSSTAYTEAGHIIIDTNGFRQTAYQTGKSNASAAPNFVEIGFPALTSDGGGSPLVWQNQGASPGGVTYFNASARFATIFVNFTPPTATNSRPLTTDEITLSLNQNLGKVQVKYGMQSLNGDPLPDPPATSGELDVYEIWVEAQAG
jgi:hypothetical protein